MIYRRVWKKRFRQMIIGMFCCSSYKWKMPSSYALIMDSVQIIVLGSSESSTLRRLPFCTGVGAQGEFSLDTLVKRLQMLLLVLSFLLCMITKQIKECIKFLIITNNGEEKLWQRCCQFSWFELHNSLPLFVSQAIWFILTRKSMRKTQHKRKEFFEWIERMKKVKWLLYIMVNQINKFRYGGVRDERSFAFLLDAHTFEPYTQESRRIYRCQTVKLNYSITHQVEIFELSRSQIKNLTKIHNVGVSF